VPGPPHDGHPRPLPLGRPPALEVQRETRKLRIRRRRLPTAQHAAQAAARDRMMVMMMMMMMRRRRMRMRRRGWAQEKGIHFCFE
jgi:hypothetical protein